ncbi:MAG: glycine zipper family protein [Pyrinomonadaceae bacterium]|nr:glycine zipper family protein [Pyrinomonadaceae bacterium]MCX7639716.1 glycine zipper family protein [Pyrinomonadaceae bacterium]MDW8304299.1 hypothetical protein [Acidobacteriota bacterium]
MQKTLLLKLKKVFLAIVILFSLLKSQTPENPYTLPAGTVIQARMDNGIGSEFSSVNDTFTLTVSQPILFNQIEVLPEGAVIEGRITKVKRASLGNKNGQLNVEIETLKLPNGYRRQLKARIVDFPESKSDPTRTILFSTIGASIGAVTGGLLGQGKYALIASGIGAVAGASVALVQKGEDVLIKSGEILKLRLEQDLVLPSQDF